MPLGKPKRISLRFILFLFLLPSLAHGGDQMVLKNGSVSEQAFFYTAKKWGIPILKASIKIENGMEKERKNLLQVEAQIESLPNLRYLFWMKNRFISIMHSENGSPISYLKEINQGGPLIKNKNYRQLITFDPLHQNVVIENGNPKERRELVIPSETYDPLSLFAKYYLMEELQPGQNLQVSIFDGIKLRKMTFQSREEKITCPWAGSIRAVRVESSTPLSTFGDREGKIQIWYTANGEKIPVLMELDLPIGKIRLELDEVKRN